MTSNVECQETLMWDIYDEYRTARLNVKCYEVKQRSLAKANLWLEYLLAIFAPGAAVGTWLGSVGTVWSRVLILITAVLAAAKPFLRLSEKEGRVREILMDCRLLHQDLQSLVQSIRAHGCCNKGHQRKFEAIQNRIENIIKKEITPVHISTRKRTKLQREVDRELPKEYFSGQS